MKLSQKPNNDDIKEWLELLAIGLTNQAEAIENSLTGPWVTLRAESLHDLAEAIYSTIEKEENFS